MPLHPPVSSEDHQQGEETAPVTVVHYGDFQCPYSAAAHQALREARGALPDTFRYVFRHFPLADVHPQASLAAEAAEAAAVQGKFWEMYELLFENQSALWEANLMEYAARAGLDVERFSDELKAGAHRAKVAASAAGGRSNGAHGTPTLFVNGEFHDNREGLWRLDYLLDTIRAAAGPHPGQP